MDFSDVTPALLTALVDMIKKGKSNTMIVNYLERDFGVNWSVRTLKRRLKAIGIRRHGNVDAKDILQSVLKEMEGPGRQIGYRHMHQRLRIRHDLPVKRSEVQRAMRLVNPYGVQARNKAICTRRDYVSVGSNWIWHIDGHDKLKKFGFAIHGCIDGFSRRILWCNVDDTNNDPEYIVRYYLDFVQQNKVIPSMTRCDAGTENVLLATCQMFLRRNHRDNLSGTNSHVYGSSMRNQRIEAYWRHLREHNSLYWESIFQDLMAEGLLVLENPIHKACLQYVFMPLLRREIDNFVEEHNCHRIRKQRGRLTPQGIPEDLYFFPELQGFRNAGFKPSDTDILEVYRELNLDCDLQDYLPNAFRTSADQFFDIEVNIGNAKEAYCALAAYCSSVS